MLNSTPKDLRKIGIAALATLIIVGQAIFIGISLYRLEQANKPQPSIFRLVGDCPGGMVC